MPLFSGDTPTNSGEGEIVALRERLHSLQTELMNLDTEQIKPSDIDKITTLLSLLVEGQSRQFFAEQITTEMLTKLTRVFNSLKVNFNEYSFDRLRPLISICQAFLSRFSILSFSIPQLTSYRENASRLADSVRVLQEAKNDIIMA